MAVKITSFEAENVKRVKAVELEPAADGLTVIGGRNGQGKTSVLDAIAWTLGGDRNKPLKAKRDGAASEPYMKAVLSNGIVVERKGSSSALKVIDPSGNKKGQRLLDSFVEQLALNLPKFMAQSGAEKTETLLSIIGVGDELARLEADEKRIYSERTAVGQMERQKRGAAEEMEHYDDAPDCPVSAADLIKRQQAILAKNGENERLRSMVPQLERELARIDGECRRLEQTIADARARLSEAEDGRMAAAAKLTEAKKTAEQLRDESTAEIERDIAGIDAINHKVRTNAMRSAAMADADALAGRYAELTRELDGIRSDKRKLLDGAELPLEGLSVEHGMMVYKGAPWDSMSGSEQLMVATAIVRRLKPECGFVLVDKLEQFDAQTLAEFGAWAESEGLQVIGTRVSTGDECQIVIEDGMAADGAEGPAGTAAVEAETKWEWE